MKRLYSITQVLGKILEVCHWIATGILLILFILTLIPGDLCATVLAPASVWDVTAKTYGLEIMICNSNGEVMKEAVRVFALGGVLTMGLMAMVFRNIYLILKTAAGKTWFSDGETPFQENVTRMVREIGIFYIASVVVGFIFTVIATVVIGPEAAEISLDLGNIMVGLLMLCLSHVFSQGTQLRQDVDGLL